MVCQPINFWYAAAKFIPKRNSPSSFNTFAIGSSSFIYLGSIGGLQRYFNKNSSFSAVFCFFIKKSQKLFHPSLKFSNCLFNILLFNFLNSSPILSSFALSLVILYE